MKIIFKCEGCGLEWAKPTDAVKCEEKHKEVTWKEAIEAWANFKVIRCEVDGQTWTYDYSKPSGRKGLVAVEDENGISPLEITDGKWFIGEKS